MARRYSERFDRDFRWLLSVRHIFSFDGKYPIELLCDPMGVDGKRAFLIYDSQGKLAATRHPNVLQALIRTKSSINLHIKEFALAAHTGEVPHSETREWLRTINAPEWVFVALDRQWRKLFRMRNRCRVV